MSPDPAKTDPESKYILVIDDDPATCAFFHTLLSQEGFQVETCSSGSDAVEMLKSDSFDHYDLILLDLMMPGYGGYEVLKELQQEGYQAPAIFIVTARALAPETVDMLRSESHVRDFVSKPIEVKTFKAKVHQVLGTTPRAKK